MKITSEGKKSGKFVLYKAEYVNSYGNVDVKEIHAYSSSDYEHILGVLTKY